MQYFIEADPTKMFVASITNLLRRHEHPLIKGSSLQMLDCLVTILMASYNKRMAENITPVEE
jgi:hypothetical protein